MSTDTTEKGLETLIMKFMTGTDGLLVPAMAASTSLHPMPVASLPRHVAIVMDGNGRWAQKRWLPRVAGHKQGVEALRRVVKASVERGLSVLSVFAFSSENWSRPAEEVSGLMDLLVMALSREVPRVKKAPLSGWVPGSVR